MGDKEIGSSLFLFLKLRTELYFAYNTIFDANIEIERLKEAKTQVDADKALILEM